MTLCPEHSASSTSWDPKIIFAAGVGKGSTDGRCIALARVFVNSALVHGFGPTRLTGPLMESSVRIRTMADTWS